MLQKRTTMPAKAPAKADPAGRLRPKLLQAFSDVRKIVCALVRKTLNERLDSETENDGQSLYLRANSFPSSANNSSSYSAICHLIIVGHVNISLLFAIRACTLFVLLSSAMIVRLSRAHTHTLHCQPCQPRELPFSGRYSTRRLPRPPLSPNLRVRPRTVRVSKFKLDLQFRQEHLLSNT